MMDNYMGLLLIIGKNKTKAFQHILNWFTSRIKIGQNDCYPIVVTIFSLSLFYERYLLMLSHVSLILGAWSRK